jgi:hypothetical protein
MLFIAVNSAHTVQMSLHRRCVSVQVHSCEIAVQQTQDEPLPLVEIKTPFPKNYTVLERT